MIYAHNTDRYGPNDSVAVIWSGERPPEDIDNWHPASGDEYEAYEAYWNANCPVCGRERGDHTDQDRQQHNF